MSRDGPKGWVGGLPPHPSNDHSRVGQSWLKPPISSLNWSLLVKKSCFDFIFLNNVMSYFVSIGHILSNLVKFCLFQSYFAHIMCYLWYLFSWSVILFSWSVIHQIDKVGQNCRCPPPTFSARTIPVCVLDVYMAKLL